MSEVLIRHCTLRLVRRGGWTWGAEPKELARRVLAALPALLARMLADLVPEDRALVVRQPVKLKLSASLTDLLAGRLEIQRGSWSANTLALELKTALRQALERSLGGALEEALLPVQPRSPAATPALQTRASARGEANQAGTPPTILLQLLMAWQERGLLIPQLLRMPEGLISRWHRLLLESHAQGAVGDVDEAATSLETLVNELQNAGLGGRVGSLRLTLTARLILAVLAAARLGLAPQTATARAALDRLLPLEPETGGTRSHESTPPVDDIRTEPFQSDVDTGVKRGQGSWKPAHSKTIQPGETWETRIDCALPFLALGPLSKMGCLDILAHSFEKPALDLIPFAASLANKVLAPPHGGWRREPSARHAAAVFAGCQEEIAEADLVHFADNAADLLLGVEALVTQSVIAGRDPKKPLILNATQKPEGFLVLDADGLFPAAFCRTVDDLATVVPEGQPFWLAGETVDSVPALEAAGLRWFCARPPVEHMARQVFLRGERCYSNDSDLGDAFLLSHAKAFSAREDELEELTEELIRARRAVVHARSGQFERGLTLIAGCSLATISWTLWREIEPSSPQLALMRFGDLDASIRFESDAVRVRLPLGRRYQDLEQAGLLADIPCIPWLGGRDIIFPGG